MSPSIRNESALEETARIADARGVPSEKERVYTELDRCRKKIARLRRELKLAKTAGSAQEATVQRQEAQQYRKALSHIVHRLEGDGIDQEAILRTCKNALLLRGLKVWQRKRIENARDESCR